MTLKRNSKKKKSSKSTGESTWVTIASILESKKGNNYFNVEDYYGDLYFLDNETKKTYRVKSAALMEPLDSAPDFVKQVIRLNLESDAVVKCED